MLSLWITLVISCLCGIYSQPPDCSKPPPIGDLTDCCKGPKAIQDDAIMAKCKPQMNYTGSGLGSIYEFACITDCFINMTLGPIGPNDKLNIPKYKDGIKNLLKDDPDYIGFYTNALTTCDPFVEDKLKNLPKPPPNNQCNPRSALLFACLMRENFVNCPDKKWTDSQPCKATRDYLKLCPLPF